MPLKKQSPCRVNGCNKLTRDGYCEEHKHIAEEKKQERNNFYNKNRQDKIYVSFYKTKAWVTIQSLVRIRDNGLCVQCRAEGRTTFADMVHHKEPLKKRWDLRLTMTNLESLCNQCHNGIDHRKL